MNLCGVPLRSGLVVFCWLCVFVPDTWAGSGVVRDVDQEIVARWSYARTASRSAEVALGPESVESEFDAVPLLVAANRAGGFYIVDTSYSSARSRGALREYSAEGREKRVFVDERLSAIYYAPVWATCTTREYVWVGKELEAPIRNRPAIAAWAYHGGLARCADLYEIVPGRLKRFLANKLGLDWFKGPAPHGGPVRVAGLFSVADRIVLYLRDWRLRKLHSKGFWLVDRMLRVEMSEDGKQFLGGSVVPWLNESRFITPTGDEWIVRLRGNIDEDGMLYLSDPWEARAHPVSAPDREISLATSQTARQLIAGYKVVRPVVLGGDQGGRIYVVLVGEGREQSPGKEQPDARELRYTRLDGSMVALRAGRRYALIVVDREGRCIQRSNTVYVPYALPPENWIQPLPDGSGYYELRLLEREAQVVFHPLPSP